MMQILLCVAFAGLLALSARTDILHRRIPNCVVGLIFLLWPLRALSFEPQAAAAALVIALGILMVGMLVWMAGWLGAGDAKLLAAVGLWAGHEHVAAILAVTTAMGGVMAVALLTIRFCRALPPSFPQTPGGGAAGSSSRSASVPYGVAIATGGFWLAGRLIAG